MWGLTLMFKYDVMLDLETMGTGPTAAIIQIGACVFDEGSVRQQFRVNVALQSSVAYGMTQDEDTQDWWRGRQGSATAFQGVSHPLPKALDDFTRWLNSIPGWREEGWIWSKGPAFDAAILEYAYRLMGHDAPPWHFRKVQDQRTLQRTATALGWVQPNYPEPAHDALKDAIDQAVQCMEMWHFIKQQVKPVVS